MFTAEELLPIKLTLELALITLFSCCWWQHRWHVAVAHQIKMESADQFDCYAAIGSSAERARFLSPRCHGTVGSFRQAH